MLLGYPYLWVSCSYQIMDDRSFKGMVLATPIQLHFVYIVCMYFSTNVLHVSKLRRYKGWLLKVQITMFWAVLNSNIHMYALKNSIYMKGKRNLFTGV